MHKVVITDYTYESLDLERAVLSRPDIELLDYQCRDEESVIRIARDCEILIVQYAPITRRVIEQLEHCRLIIRYAIGVDNIDLEAASERGIYVANVPDYGVDEVSTYAAALLLAAARKLPQTIRHVRAGCWNYALEKPLHRTFGSRLGLVGLGRIPSSLAQKLSGFGMEIIAYDPYTTSEHAAGIGVRLTDFDELVETSDYISIHCPLTPETTGLFCQKVFRRMKPTAYLINTARGGVVNEADLVQACTQGWIAGAAVDVTEYEPISKESPLLTLENVIVTPHMAWYTEESIEALKTKLAQEVLRVINGQEPIHLVNRAALAARRQK